MSNEGQISEDGMWRWDGQRWVPNTTQPTSPLPKRKGNGKRNLAIGCGSAIALLVIIGVISAATSGSGSSSKSSTASKPTPAATAAATAKPASTPKPAPAAACQQPCAVADNVTLTVSNIQNPAQAGEFDSPQPGTQYVTMTVTAHNAGDSEYNFNATNFVLQDAGGVKHMYSPMLSNQATSWSPVNLTKGATQAEVISFEVPQGQTTGLTLVWTPGLFSGDHNIKLS